MAEVDFSNARIEPVAYPNPFNGYTTINPTGKGNLSLDFTSDLWDANQNTITSSLSKTRLINEKKQLMFLYQGTFNTSGTEFYIIHYGDYTMGAWKISNISFNSGDTYVFQINATLDCN